MALMAFLWTFPLQGDKSHQDDVCVPVSPHPVCVLPLRLHVQGGTELGQQQTSEVVLLLEVLRELEQPQDPLLLLETARTGTLNREKKKEGQSELVRDKHTSTVQLCTF